MQTRRSPPKSWTIHVHRHSENETILVLPRILRSTQKFNQVRSNEEGRRARSLSRGTASHQGLL